MRKVLNFGHTVGHAMESHFLPSADKRLLHGEAVAAGMMVELFLSGGLTGLGEEEIQDAVRFLYQTFGKIRLEEEDIDAILDLTRQDKKMKATCCSCRCCKI
jgi:3-dehydroquinate synthase